MRLCLNAHLYTLAKGLASVGGRKRQVGDAGIRDLLEIGPLKRLAKIKSLLNVQDQGGARRGVVVQPQKEMGGIARNPRKVKCIIKSRSGDRKGIKVEFLSHIETFLG